MDQALRKHWFGWHVGPSDQPIDLIRSYFGEKVRRCCMFAGVIVLCQLNRLGYPLSLTMLLISIGLEFFY
jgi:hypothetical protein